MDRNPDNDLKELVAHEPLDRAVALIITELRDNITRIRTGLVIAGVLYPEPSEPIKYVDLQLNKISQSINELINRGSITSSFTRQ